MARDPRHDVLFEPIAIGPKTLRNRFYQVPHCTGFGNDKPWSQARHRGMKAEGGWAAVCTEYCSVSPDADESPFAMARMWDEADVGLLRHMTADAHAHGALAGVELFHAGVHSENNESRLPGIGPSQVASDYSGSVPHAMDLDDVARLRGEWRAAAVRARDAGFDIVYVYGAHTYLLGQFLSPFYNHRTDAYGGSLENRARLWLEVLGDVHEAVGADCAIACRIAVAGAGGAGIDLEDGLAFIRMADHLVDLWDVNVSSIADWAIDSGSSRFFPAGWQLEWTGRVREATAKPIVGVGRLTSPDQMAEIVRSGAWDIIGAARPSIADPFLPNKVDEGRLDDIRECIGCNQCISKGDTRHHLGCTQNATAGEEFRRGWHPEQFERAANAGEDVLVVGAGPAGLECAIVLARRGFRRIHLTTADADLGGILTWVPRLPGLGEWGRLLDWRRIQLQKLRRQVEVHVATRLTADDVRTYGADLVVVATGSHWATDGLNGFTRGPMPGADAGLAHVLTPEQVMLERKRPPGQRVVVIDCDRYFMGAGMAELLRGEGYEVTVAAANEAVAPLCDETLEGPMLRRHLHDLGIAVRAGHVVERVEVGGVIGTTELGDPFEFACDAVVLVTQRVSDDDLVRGLKADRGDARAVYAIGDCVSPRLIADAIFDGHRLAREIDAPDPARPLPYRRERPPISLAGMP